MNRTSTERRNVTDRKISLRLILGLVATVAASLLFSGAGSANAAPATPVYVALGDSFAAGPGSGISAEDQSVYAAGTGKTGNQCYRAKSAYPTLVAQNKGYTLVNATCSGAVTADILNQVTRTTSDGRTVTIPPQIDSVPTNANVVTITIGGNDAQFVPFVACVVGNVISGDNPCTEASSATIATRAAIATLQAKVAGTIDAVKAKAPEAKIIVTGYPRVVSESANIFNPATSGCTPWLTGTEGQISNSINRGLNAAIQQAAAASGVTYVDFYDKGSFDLTTTACSLFNRKINGAIALAQEASFHPNNQGQWAMAALVGAVA